MRSSRFHLCQCAQQSRFERELLQQYFLPLTVYLKGQTSAIQLRVPICHQKLRLPSGRASNVMSRGCNLTHQRKSKFLRQIWNTQLKGTGLLRSVFSGDKSRPETAEQQKQGREVFCSFALYGLLFQFTPHIASRQKLSLLAWYELWQSLKVKQGQGHIRQ